MGVKRWSPHHASGPAVHHLRQAELELPHELLGRLGDPAFALQLSDSPSHRQDALNALGGKGPIREEERRLVVPLGC